LRPAWRLASSLKLHFEQIPDMTWLRASFLVAVCLAASAAFAPASADDALKLAVGGRGNWDSSPPELGRRAGIFKRHGLDLEVLFTAGGGETQQAVISGAVDIGVAVGTSGVMAAYAKGAPVRAIGSVTTGTSDVYYFVRPDSPLKSLKDATESTTIAYSSTGSSTNLIALGLVRVYGIKAKPTRTGDPQATLTQVMSGQVDVGYAGAPFALPQLAEGKIRMIARASDIPEMRDQTVRLLVVNAGKLAKDKELIARFMRAYADTVDWMYSDPAALEHYRDYSGVPVAITKKGLAEFFTREMLDPYRISGLDAAMADAIAVKLLPAPLTKEQLGELFQVPPRAK
jgi:NitT/TauT family transport system substrate-binding protein